MFDLELPGVEGSERRGFVVFMQKTVPLHQPLHARPRAGVVLYGLPRVSSGRAEVEDEVPIGLPRPSEFELSNAACS